MKHAYYLAIICILLLVILAQRACLKQKPCPESSEKVDTTMAPSIDSTGWYMPQPDFIQGGKIPDADPAKPSPAMVITKKDSSAPVPVVITTTPQPSAAKTDTAFYSDSVAVKYGHVIIKDSVWDNRIQKRNVETNLQLPIITKTITLSPPEKNQWFLGIDAMAGGGISGTGPSILIVGKKSKAFEVGAMITNVGPIYKGGIKFKL